MTLSSPLRITYLTAGAAGMYCGSCMHDNTLARALVRLGVDVQLVPMYTPIQTDEADVSVDQVFFGGINVYLQQQFRLFRYLPRVFDRLLDSPRLLAVGGVAGHRDPGRSAGRAGGIHAAGVRRDFSARRSNGCAGGSRQGPRTGPDQLHQPAGGRLRSRPAPRTGRPANRHAAGRRYLPRAAALRASNPGVANRSSELPNMSMHCWSTAITTRSSWPNISRYPPPNSAKSRWELTPMATHAASTHTA